MYYNFISLVDETIKATQLKEWYENFLKLFREEYSKLSDEEKEHISSLHDYHSPCQIEVFWLEQPEWQLIVETHFEDRPDGEITINGPYDSGIFQDKIKAILNLPKWHVPIDDSSSAKPEKYYDERLAERLHHFVESAKNALFFDWRKLQGHTTLLVSKHDKITHYCGNMGDFDHRAFIQHIINETKEQLEDSKTIPSTPRKSSPEIKYLKGFATYFFPPIIIGENSRRTVNEIFHGVKSTSFSLFHKELFDVTFDDVFVLAEKDGFIGVYTDNIVESLEILNTIMMVSVFDGLDAHVVREHELSEIEYDPKMRNIISRSYSYNSPRNKLFDGIPDKTPEYETRHVDEERIKKIFEKASKIFADKNLADDLRILLESTTHMKNSEFPQAFIMSWNIIEKHITQKWKKEFSRYSKTPKPDYQLTVDTKIKNLEDKLQERLSDFMELKKIRNNYLHNGKRVTQKEAQKCVDVSQELILRNSNLTE